MKEKICLVRDILNCFLTFTLLVCLAYIAMNPEELSNILAKRTTGAPTIKISKTKDENDLLNKRKAEILEAETKAFESMLDSKLKVLYREEMNAVSAVADETGRKIREYKNYTENFAEVVSSWWGVSVSDNDINLEFKKHIFNESMLQSIADTGVANFSTHSSANWAKFNEDIINGLKASDYKYFDETNFRKLVSIKLNQYTTIQTSSFSRIPTRLRAGFAISIACGIAMDKIAAAIITRLAVVLGTRATTITASSTTGWCTLGLSLVGCWAVDKYVIKPKLKASVKETANEEIEKIATTVGEELERKLSEAVRGSFIKVP